MIYCHDLALVSFNRSTRVHSQAWYQLYVPPATSGIQTTYHYRQCHFPARLIDYSTGSCWRECHGVSQLQLRSRKKFGILLASICSVSGSSVVPSRACCVFLAHTSTLPQAHHPHSPLNHQGDFRSRPDPACSRTGSLNSGASYTESVKP